MRLCTSGRQPLPLMTQIGSTSYVLRTTLLQRHSHLYSKESMTMDSAIQSVPTEIWLEILEHTCTSVGQVEHLWISLRPVSRQFRDLVGRLFLKSYLPLFTILLPLPCRDPHSGATKWPDVIHHGQMAMSLESLSEDKSSAIFVSPLEIKTRDSMMSRVEELRRTNLLPKARLLEALPWVHTGKMIMGGHPLEAPRAIEWDEQRKRWVWQLDWKKMVSQFFKAKMEARIKARVKSGARAKPPNQSLNRTGHP
jgi:hypothetical protein